MNANNESPAALLPCPFCGGDAYFERTGTQRRSCLVSCTECGARHESSDEGDQSGSSWNHRASTAPGASESRGIVPDGYAVLPRETTCEMQDAVRYLLVGLEQPGRTFGSVRKHCERSGMDVSHWPEWTRENDNAHFTKAACAAILWHCMQHAVAPTPPAVSNGEPPDWAIAQAFREAAAINGRMFSVNEAIREIRERAADLLARSAAAKGEG